MTGGAVFLALEMLMVPLFLGGSPWGPPRAIAATLLGRGVLPSPPPPPTFDLGVFLVALVVHFALSIIFALGLAWLIRRWGAGTALLVGAVFGFVLYLVNFYLFTGLFPWFAASRHWVTVFTHLVFGVVAGVYKRLEKSPGEAREPLPA